MIPRPLEHLKRYSERYPAAWQQAEEMRLIRGKELPQWPDWCYLPLAGAYSTAQAGTQTGSSDEARWDTPGPRQVRKRSSPL